MFLHIVALDRQLSVHADEKKPLSKAIDEAFKYHKRTRLASHVVTSAQGLKLDPAKTPTASGLKENDVVYVGEPAPPPTRRKKK